MHRCNRRSFNTRNLLAAASTLAILGASHAHAGLMIDVRAVGGTAGVTITENGKTVFVTGAGETVSIGVFARVSGTDGDNTNERLQQGFGSMISAPIAVPATGQTLLLGNLSGGVVAPYNSASANGSIQDVDSDGDLDIGSNGSTATGKISFRSGTSGGESLATAPKIDPNTSEVLVYQAAFNVTSSSGGTDINWHIRTNATRRPLPPPAPRWGEGRSTPA